MKKLTSIRLSAKSVERLAWLQEKLEMTQTAVIELAIRALAKKEKRS